MKGEHIHILEELELPGGACDGIKEPQKGFVIRGGREMENHFECLWDLFRSIPSIETEGASVLDEYYWLNKKDPNYSLMRATVNRGEDAHTDGKFGLSDKAAMEIVKLFLTRDEDLYDKTIADVFDRGILLLQLLAVLADHVRLRGLAQRPGDEAVYPAVHPPYRRPARLFRPEIHQVQPV